MGEFEGRDDSAVSTAREGSSKLMTKKCLLILANTLTEA